MPLVDPSSFAATYDPHGKLAGVHPTLVAKIGALAVALDAVGHPIVVTAGVRTTEQQQALYAQGRTEVGSIVTEDDGVVHRSNHQVHDDGFGHAVDCAFVVDGEPSWDPHLPWTIYGSLAMLIGLHWGGTWTTPHDLPHVELP